MVSAAIWFVGYFEGGNEVKRTLLWSAFVSFGNSMIARTAVFVAGHIVLLLTRRRLPLKSCGSAGGGGDSGNGRGRAWPHCMIPLFGYLVGWGDKCRQNFFFFSRGLARATRGTDEAGFMFFCIIRFWCGEELVRLRSLVVVVVLVCVFFSACFLLLLCRTFRMWMLFVVVGLRKGNKK